MRVTLSFVEIYNEKIRDLLASGGSGAGALRVREHPTVGPYAEGASRFVVNGNADKALKLLAAGVARRSTANNGWHAQSSRSHAVVTLEISQGLDMLGTASSIAPHRRPAGLGGRGAPAAADPLSHRFDDVETDRHYVRLRCIDLAGSEKDPASFTLPQQQQLQLQQQASAAMAAEARSIRRSLSTLGHVLRALCRGEPTKSLPYRDSTLTWLLRDALSGRNHTTVLVTVSPASVHHEESVNTLRYAERLCSAPPAARALSAASQQPPAAASGRTRRTDSDPPPSAHARPYGHPAAAPSAQEFEYGLGGRPGSAAARSLLQRAVADPQQRLARMGVHSPPSYLHPPTNPSQHAHAHAHVHAQAQAQARQRVIGASEYRI